MKNFNKNELTPPYVPTERNWYSCPLCGQNLLIYNNTASCEGAFIRCKKCGAEVEIKIAKNKKYQDEPLSQVIYKKGSE